MDFGDHTESKVKKAFNQEEVSKEETLPVSVSRLARLIHLAQGVRKEAIF